MKKLSYIGLAILAVAGFSSCKDDQDPKIDTSKDFKFTLNVPQFATQFIDLQTQGTMQFTVSQPNYGLTVVPTYGLEISLNSDFSPITNEPAIDADGNEVVVPGVYALNLDSQLAGILVAKMADIAAGINLLEGLLTEEQYVEKYGEDGDGYVGPLYVRSTAYLGSGTAAEVTATVSNAITLTQVQGFASFASTDVFVSVPGGANDWNHLPQLLYTGDTEDGSAMKFQGFAVIDGGFKFTDGDWEGSGNWGATDDGITKNADGTYTGKLIQNSQNDFTGVPTGLYYIYAEVTDMKNGNDKAEVGTFTMTEIVNVFLPGDYNGWDAAGNPLTQDGNYYSWSGSYGITAAGWKFAMNGSWDINLGGDPEELSFDGANLTLTGGKVTLNLEQYPWTCTVE